MDTKRQTITSLLLLASCALLGACSGDTPKAGSPRGSLLEENGTAMPASLHVSPRGTPTLEPLDAKSVAGSWKDGVSSFENGDYDAAVSQLEVAVGGRSTDPYAHYLLGLAQWKTGRLEEAARSLETSLSQDATRPRTWVNLARVRMELGDAKGALEAADK